MSQKEKYIAITFGPITRVISYAQSTKELWAASYLFSYLAKQVIEPFKERTFLLPQITEEMYNKKLTKGAGLFSDRYIFQAKDGDFEKLCDGCDKVYKQLGENIATTIKRPEEAIVITDYLKRTIKIYCLEKEFSSSENIVHLCEDLLGAMELQDLFLQKESCNYLSCFFKQVNNSFLTDDAFEQGTARLFNTIIEYSAIELNSDKYWKPLEANEKVMAKNKKVEKINRISSSALVDEKRISLLEQEKSLKPYHKYIAFVKADSDHLTKTIKGLKDQKRSVAELDKCLLTYNLQVIQLIEDYQGKAIFLGGDDLLFFAPVRNGEKNIFTLLHDINSAFDSAMEKLPAPPTLSFGVSISYYKHPMFEAIDKAEELLSKAKGAGRNSIAWYLQKHSGQVCQSIINKTHKEVYTRCELISKDKDCVRRIFKDVYTQCTELISKGMIDKNSSENLLNSFTYWLMENKEIITYILNPLQSTNSEKEENVIKTTLINYFNNSFNEPRLEKMNSYIEDLAQYLISATKEAIKIITKEISEIKTKEKMDIALEKKKKRIENVIDSLGAILRFVRFLKSEKP